MRDTGTGGDNLFSTLLYLILCSLSILNIVKHRLYVCHLFTFLPIESSSPAGAIWVESPQANPVAELLAPQVRLNSPVLCCRQLCQAATVVTAKLNTAIAKIIIIIVCEADLEVLMLFVSQSVS